MYALVQVEHLVFVSEIIFSLEFRVGNIDGLRFV